MMYNEFDYWMWASAPECQTANYNYYTLDFFRKAPKKWLASLPMFEYAHILSVVTALRMGGDPDKYVEDLYIQRMNPILKAYYDKLARYRYHRAIFMRPTSNLKHKVNNTTLVDESAKMRAYAMKTRKALRNVCKDFEDELTGKRKTRKKVEDTLPETYPI